MSTIEVAVQLTKISCGTCAGTYAIAEKYRSDKENEGASWHCPYCRACWGYAGTGTNQKLKDEIKRKDAEIERRVISGNRMRADLKHVEAMRRAEKGAKTKLKKRLAGGACPCCDRTFTNLHRHMKTKHPDYVKDAP